MAPSRHRYSRDSSSSSSQSSSEDERHRRRSGSRRDRRRSDDCSDSERGRAKLRNSNEAEVNRETAPRVLSTEERRSRADHDKDQQQQQKKGNSSDELHDSIRRSKEKRDHRRHDSEDEEVERRRGSDDRRDRERRLEPVRGNSDEEAEGRSRRDWPLKNDGGRGRSRDDDYKELEKKRSVGENDDDMEEGELPDMNDDRKSRDKSRNLDKEIKNNNDRVKERDRESRRNRDDDVVKNRDKGGAFDVESEKKDDRVNNRDRDRIPQWRDRYHEERRHKDRSSDKEKDRENDRGTKRDRESRRNRADVRKKSRDKDRRLDEENEKTRDRERSPHRRDVYHEERRARDGGGKKSRDKSSDEEYEKKDDRGKKRDRKSRHREQEENRVKDAKEESKREEPPAVEQMPDAGVIKTGGIYIPPHRMAQMMREVQDKSSEQYQRLSWDALRKSINGLVNKVNATNIKNIIPELFSENLIRGRGLFCRSCMKSQMASPGFTDVFAALVAVVNTKFPEVGKLLLRRIVLQLRRAYKRNDKPQLLAATKFIAHLVNQQVAHEIIALELLTLLLEKPTDDSVEVAVGFVKECGALLQDFSPQGLHGIFERFRGILHEGEIDKRVQFLIEGLFAIRKAKFQGFPAIRPELDLVEQEDQYTHEVSLEDEVDPETSLDVFKSNLQFLEDEKAYEDLKISILGEESSDDEEGSDAASDDEDEEESEEEEEENMEIKDETETNLVNLRRTIYLTIMSSVDFEEAGHKLLKIKLEPGQEMELCIMLLECCSQERTYLRYYGLLGQRFCMINKVHQENFEKCFVQQYSMIHRLETNKLRNVAKFFAHLLGTSALPWHVLAYIRLTEEDTTSSSRIFIKILFQELSEHLGIRLLNERLNDPTMQGSFESIFPKDNPKNTRFSINFFTSIGLGGITESLREYLKNMPRLIMQQQKAVLESDDGSGSSSSGSSSSETESSSESESELSSDEGERNKRHSKKRRK